MLSVTKIYALMGEENDSYDVGTHLEVVDMFVLRTDAERVRNELIGKSKVPRGTWDKHPPKWHDYELEIEEFTLR